MLYPDFKELLALRLQATKLMHTFSKRTLLSLAGEYSTAYHGQGLEFDGVREYELGDDIRNIDWKVTARTDKTHTKVFKAERERGIMVCVDINSYMHFGTRVTFKSIQAARAAALLAWVAKYNNHQVGACLFGDIATGHRIFKASKTNKNILAMLHLLSKPENCAESLQVNSMLVKIRKSVPRGGVVYIISDFMHVDMQEFRKQLFVIKKFCDVVLIRIEDCSDKEIANINDITFSFNNDKYTCNNIDLKTKQLYRDLWENNNNDLLSITKSLKTDLINISTENDVSSVLTKAIWLISNDR